MLPSRHRYVIRVTGEDGPTRWNRGGLHAQTLPGTRAIQGACVLRSRGV